MSQKLAQEAFQLARGEETQLRGKGKFRKKQKISLIDKEKAKLHVDNTEENIKKLTRKDYRKLSQYKTTLLGKLTNFDQDYIALKNQKTADKLEKERKEAELDKDLDSFIADFFKDTKKEEPYKSENVIRRERKKEIAKKCSVYRLPGCG